MRFNKLFQIDTIKASDSKKVLTIETKQNGISIAFKVRDKTHINLSSI